MSVKVSSWAWHGAPENIRGNTLLALLALADIADDDGNCVFAEDTSQATLARKARMSVSQFREVTKTLQELEVLSSARANRTAQKTYRINVTADFRRSDSGGRTAEDQRSGTPVSGGRSFNHVSNVGNVLSSSDAAASDRVELTPTGRVKKPTKTEADFDSDVIRLCEMLAFLVRQNDHRVETIGVRWWNACRLLIEVDGFEPRQIEIIARWATADPFWSSNIRSMPTLREKFTTLRSQRNAQLSNSRGGHSTVDQARRIDEELRKQESLLEVGA